MNEHPVPQQISSYEFRLVGDMTLKQFFQLAGGAVIALVIYATGLPVFIKWPLMLFFVFLGVALAFLPFQERSLSSWIIAFLRAIYSPTSYKFQAGRGEDVFAEPAAPPTAKTVSAAAPATKPKPASEVEKPFEEAEASFLTRVTSFFHPTDRPIPRVVEIKETAVASPPAVAPPIAPPITFRRPEKTKTPAGAATFVLSAAPPAPPEIVNTVVGQVLDNQGKIVAGAILEIRDAAGTPMRALKTNKLGHFLTATPLADGEYVMEVEKENLSFVPVKFQALGKIIPPIQIRAKSATKN